MFICGCINVNCPCRINTRELEEMLEYHCEILVIRVITEGCNLESIITN